MNNSKRRHIYLQWRTWLIYAVLFSIAVPWYWPSNPITTTFGLPTWVVVTLVSSVAISGYTAWLLLFRWPQPPTTSDDRDG